MYGWRGRLGVTLPQNNTVLEPEMYSVLPPGVSLHGSRLVARGAALRERIFSMTDALPDAIAGFENKVGVYSYACMTTSLLKPLGWHEALSGATGGVPFLPAGETMVQALRHLGARRIGVFSPYSHEVADLVPRWFAQFGIEVVHNVNVAFTDDTVVSQRCEDLYPVLRREFRGKTIDTMAILATDLATFSVIDALEADFGVPIVSSNLALLWAMLGVLGVGEFRGPGTLSGRPLVRP